MNPFLSHPGTVSGQSRLIKYNQGAILQSYNPKLYRQILQEIYLKVKNTAVKQRIDKKVLASEFLNLEKFSLLKWSDYNEQGIH